MSPLKPRSLVGRVALSAALGGLFSGTVVAIVTIVLSSRLAHAREDADLHGVAEVLAYALTVKHYKPERAAEDQRQEHAHAGITVAVFERDRRAAGEPSISPVAPETCQDLAEARACAVSAGPWTAVAARDRAFLSEQADLSMRAASTAVIVASILSSMLALALAYTAVDPLKKLARAVQGVPVVERGEAALGPHVGVREVDALRATLQSMFDRHARALAQSRSFADHAAHQLRDPLATIVRELDRTLERGAEPALEERSRARRVAARLSELVERLLILASPRDALSGGTVTSLRGSVAQAIETLPEAARQRIACEGPELEIRSDPALLVSAIASALENALKYSAGAVQVRIEPHASPANLVTLAIEDDGPGVSAAERERLFLPFYRGQHTRGADVPGHGIGLAVIARVTQVHGGTARFAERERGARLEMTFATKYPERTAGFA
jgi:signal transduction histidine kinase